MGLDRRGDQRPETGLQGFGEACAVFAPGDALHGAHQLDQQLPGVFHLEIHLAAGAQFDRQAHGGLDEAHLAVGAPFDGHLDGLVDEVDLAVEGGVAAGGAVQQAAKLGNVLGFQGVTARAKGVQSLTVHKEDGLLALVNDQLGQGVEILQRVLPDKGRIVTFVFDNFCNLRHWYTSSPIG